MAAAEDDQEQNGVGPHVEMPKEEEQIDGILVNVAEEQVQEDELLVNVDNKEDDNGSLLDAFPLTSYELERLLHLHKFYRNHAQDTHQWLFSDWLASDPDMDDHPHVELVTHVEKTLLPPGLAYYLLQTALETVIVLGPSSCDDENTSKDDSIDERTFLEAMVTCLGRRGPKVLVDLVAKAAVAASNGHADDDSTCYQWIHRLAVASHVLRENGATQKHALNYQTKTPTSWSGQQSSSSSFAEWAMSTAPQAYTALSTVIHTVLFSPSHPFRPSTPPLLLPQLDQPSVLWRHCDEALPISLALLSPSLGGAWRRLYSSDSDGCSFRTMQQALLGYRGPTVILIRSTVGDVFGYSTDCPWKLSQKWFGEGSDSFLFTLHPTVAVYPATGMGKHYMYLNLPAQHRPQDLKGMAIGGIAHDRPRLHVTESFEHCRVSAIDTTYASGPIISDDMEAYFDVDVLEVWATNTNDQSFHRGSQSGALQVAIHEATRRQAATVDRGQFVDDFASGIIPNHVYDHRDHTVGRHDV